MNQLNLTPFQQQRYNKALDDYFQEPVNAKNRNKQHIQDESVRLATLAARADVMSDDEFKKVTSELYNLGLESGDVGGAFYARVIANLKELRRLPS